MKILITGAAGFIGSHLADYFIEKGHNVTGIDSLLTGSMENVNPKMTFINADIRHPHRMKSLFISVRPDWVFHEAAIARTPWTIDDPGLCHDTNVTGTFNVLMAAKLARVKRVILASSNIVYAAHTPYWASKLMLEHYAQVFNDVYNLSTMSLRYSNVYGSLRQSEQGPSINCIASLRKSKRENGYIWLTGDGKQTRTFTHIDDICRANELAVESKETGSVDVCSQDVLSMNQVAEFFQCPIKYVEDRPGDIKTIPQSPLDAYGRLGFTAKVHFDEGIKVYL
jgi:nucleoside-diphosphate-sugar epimerase